MKIFRDEVEDNFQEKEEENIESLRSQLHLAKRQMAFFEMLNRAVPISGVIIFIVMVIVYWSSDARNTSWLAIGLFYLTVASASSLFPLGTTFESEIEALETEISLSVSGAAAIELRSERLFKNHEIDLKKYYRQSLNHSNVIFLAGIVCILAGFGIIAATYFVVWNQDSNIKSFDEKVLATIFGLVSGILVNFIAVIYIRMFSETTKALTSFHQKLVSTNHLHFANFLTTKIDNIDKRDDVIALIVSQISNVENGDK